MTGALDAARRWMADWRARDTVAVLGYHRVGDPAATEWDKELITATAEDLERHVRFLQSRYRVVGLEEAIALLAGRERMGRTPAVMLTFDDGYLDNYETALPVLRARAVPAVFFLCVDFVLGRRVPWWDQIAWMCKRAGDGRAEERIAAYKSPGMTDDSLFFARLEEELGVSRPFEARELFLDVGQAKEMIGAGMAVGAHTCTHPVLSKLSGAEQRAELAESKLWLQGQLGVPVAALAYPVGSRDAFTRETMEAAREVGYEACFSYYGGRNRAGEGSMFDVKRVPVYFGVPNEYLIREG